MQRCNLEGGFSAKIFNVEFIQNRFNKPEKEEEIDVKITFIVESEGVEPTTGEAYLSLSNDIIQKGNDQGKSSVSVSLDTLEFLGLPKTELANVAKLHGVEISVFAKRGGDQGQYLNFYINKRAPEQVVTPEAMQQRMNVLLGIGGNTASPVGATVTTAPVQQAVTIPAVTPVAKSDPFAVA
jgi:hypothetical protein